MEYYIHIESDVMCLLVLQGVKILTFSCQNILEIVKPFSHERDLVFKTIERFS